MDPLAKARSFRRAARVAGKAAPRSRQNPSAERVAPIDAVDDGVLHGEAASMTTEEPLFQGQVRVGLLDSLDLHSWRGLPFFPVGAAFFIWLAVGDWLPFRGTYTNVFLLVLSGTMLFITLLGLCVLIRSFIAIRRAGPMNVALKIFPDKIGWSVGGGDWCQFAFSDIVGCKKARHGLFLDARSREGSNLKIFVPRACFPASWAAVHAFLKEKVHKPKM
jgi:hypothetical protein